MQACFWPLQVGEGLALTQGRQHEGAIKGRWQLASGVWPQLEGGACPPGLSLTGIIPHMGAGAPGAEGPQ